MIWKYKSNSIFSQQQRSRLEHRSAPQWSPIHPAPGWQWHFPPCPFDTAFLKIPLLLSCNSLLNNFTFSQIILYTILKCYFVRNTFSTAESSTSSVCSVSFSPGAPVTLCSCHPLFLHSLYWLRKYALLPVFCLRPAKATVQYFDIWQSWHLTYCGDLWPSGWAPTSEVPCDCYCF